MANGNPFLGIARGAQMQMSPLAALAEGIGGGIQEGMAENRQAEKRNQAMNYLQKAYELADTDPQESQMAFVQAAQLDPDAVNTLMQVKKIQSAGQDTLKTGRFQYKDTPTGFLKIDTATGEQEFVSMDDKQAEVLRKRQEEKLESEVEATDKKFDQSKKLRDEYRSISKDFESVADAYGRVQASVESPDAAGDIALIFNYMKMLDPGSVVREGEFATAQNAGGVNDSVRNMYNKIVSGERLQPSQRAMFSDRAEKLYNVARKKNDKRKAGIVRVGKRYGIEEPDIFGGDDYVVISTEQYGDVTEADIKQTMKETGMSRDEVMQRLRGE